MSLYYCPYCSPQDKTYVQDDQRINFCLKCGEPLTKIPVVKTKQIAALLILIAFISPFLIYFVNELIKNIEIKPKNKYEYNAMVLEK